MMMAFAVMGVFLVNDLFKTNDSLQQASQAIKQHIVAQAYPDDPAALTDEAKIEAAIPKSQWEDVITKIAYAPEEFGPLGGQLAATLGDRWQEKVHLVGYNGTVNPERILPAVLLFQVPPGLRGLFVTALLAAAMSTFTPTVNMATAMFTRDIYQAFFRKSAATRELIWASYAFGVVLTMGGFAMAYTTTSINDIWDWIIMGLTAGIVLPNVFRLYWWRFNSGGLVWGTATGLVASIAQRFIAPELGPDTKFYIATVASLVGCVAGTYLTEPTERSVLEHFYRTTRPFGLWGPMRYALTPEQDRATRRENFYDIISTPFALMWQITLFLLPMAGDHRRLEQLLANAVHLRGLAVWRCYLLWYRQLPPANAPMAPPASTSRLPSLAE